MPAKDGPGQILAGMETALNRSAKLSTPYGSSIHKQVYVYGALDPRPMELQRNFGMAWGIGGWLLRPFPTRYGRRGLVAQDLISAYVRVCCTIRPAGHPGLSPRLAPAGQRPASLGSGRRFSMSTRPPIGPIRFLDTLGFNFLTASAKSIASGSSSGTTRPDAR